MDSKLKIKYPIAIQWKMPETKLLEERNSIGGRLDSDTFDIPGTDVLYYVTIYPNESLEERRGQTWIYFHLMFEEKKEIESEFVISIESANYSEENKYVYKESWGRGGRICTTNELFDLSKNFIVDGEMIVKVEGFLMMEMDAPKKLFDLGCDGNILVMTLWNQETKDFAIFADGKEIMVHKWVLSTRSPVFAAMFQPHTREAQENRVTIPDFSFDVVEIAVKICYDSRLVQSNVSIEDQISLLKFFDKYDMQMLKTNLENFMISEINEFTVCRLANGSILTNAPKLRKKCAEFLDECRHRTPVSDFEILNKDFVFDMVKNSLFQLSL